MANVPESATFDAGIYQLEITDAVIGGVNGISNLQAKGLANRTKWLKQQVDALNLLKGTVAIFSAANSYSGGQQVIYQKNIWQANTAISPGAFNPANWTRQLGVAAESALATAAPLIDGTAAVGTSTNVAREDHVHPTDTTRLAVSDLATQAEALAGTSNTKWMSPLLVAQASGTTITSINASRPLLASELGLVHVDATSAAVTITLPASDASLGIRDVILRRLDNTGNRLVIQSAGTDKIKFHTHLASAGYLFFVLMGAGDWWRLRSDGAGNWWPVGRYDSTPLGRPVFETTTAFSPGGWAGINGFIYNRAEWPWVWDHAQQSGMLTTEALRAGKEGCWTSGDGATTFRSPEGRGEFLRVLDEKRGVEKDVIYGNLTVGSPTITAVSFIGSTFGNGATISGTGIPVGATVLSMNVATGTITMSANATAAGSTSVTVIGRQPGSSQAGTPNSIDTGASNAVLSGKVSGINDPGVARVGFAMDEGDITKYHANAGQFAIGATNGGPFSTGTEVSWGQVRPRNIAYPGRLKLI